MNNDRCTNDLPPLKDVDVQEVNKLIQLYEILFNCLKSNKNDHSHLLERFECYQPKEPFYKKLQHYSDLEKLVDEFNGKTDDMQKNIDININPHFKSSHGQNIDKLLSSIRNIIKEFVSTVRLKTKKIKLNKSATVEEIQSDFYIILSKLLKKNLIDRIIPAFFLGMQKGNHIKIYEGILKNINLFLSELGVYTLKIAIGQKIDFEICEGVLSDQNKTSRYELQETIKEIRQLPYVFDDKHIVAEGKVVVWRYCND